MQVFFFVLGMGLVGIGGLFARDLAKTMRKRLAGGEAPLRNTTGLLYLLLLLMLMVLGVLLVSVGVVVRG